MSVNCALCKFAYQAASKFTPRRDYGNLTLLSPSIFRI